MWQQVKLSGVSLGTRPLYNLVADKGVKKPKTSPALKTKLDLGLFYHRGIKYPSAACSARVFDISTDANFVLDVVFFSTKNCTLIKNRPDQVRLKFSTFII